MTTFSVKRRLFNEEEEEEKVNKEHLVVRNDQGLVACANVSVRPNALANFPEELIPLIVLGCDDCVIREDDFRLIVLVTLCTHSMRTLQFKSKGDMILSMRTVPSLIQNKGLRFPFTTNLFICSYFNSFKMDLASRFPRLGKLVFTILPDRREEQARETESALVLPRCLSELQVKCSMLNPSLHEELTNQIFNVATHVESLVFSHSQHPRCFTLNYLALQFKKMPRLTAFKTVTPWHDYITIDTDETLASKIENVVPWIQEHIPLADPFHVDFGEWHGFLMSRWILKHGGPLVFAALEKYNILPLARLVESRYPLYKASARFSNWLFKCPTRLSVERILDGIDVYLDFRHSSSFLEGILNILRTKMKDVEIWDRLTKHFTINHYEMHFYVKSVFEHLSIGALDGVVPPLYFAASHTEWIDTDETVYRWLERKGYNVALLKNNPLFFDFLLPQRLKWESKQFTYAMDADPKRFVALISTDEFLINSAFATACHAWFCPFGSLMLRKLHHITDEQAMAIHRALDREQKCSL